MHNTMSEPTPGPWQQNGNLIVKFGEGGRAIALLADSRSSNTGNTEPAKLDDPDWDTNMANAHLLVAAPDLLKACGWAMDIFSNDASDEERESAFEMMRSAVNKARGSKYISKSWGIEMADQYPTGWKHIESNEENVTSVVRQILSEKPISWLFGLFKEHCEFCTAPLYKVFTQIRRSRRGINGKEYTVTITIEFASHESRQAATFCRRCGHYHEYYVPMDY